jgi:hypothetical protein
MDTGQTVYIISQLSLGAAAVFFAILLWPRTRDAAWMLVIAGTILIYTETVYNILNIFGIGVDAFFLIGSVPVITFVLPSLRMLLFIAAFTIMVFRQSRHK